MKISILIPSHRASSIAISKGFQLADLNHEKFDVIFRDNSENSEKQDILSKVISNCFKYQAVENMGAAENFSSLLKDANQDYSLFMADDDMVFTSSLEDIHSRLPSEIGTNYIGMTFGYLITSWHRDFIYNYEEFFSSKSAADRVKNFTHSMTQGPNLLFYSIFKTESLKKGFKFLNSLPYQFSHADQLFSIYMLLHGPILSDKRVVYNYDMAEWSTHEKSQRKDMNIYIGQGLNPEINTIHNLIQAIEGYFLISSKTAKEITGEDLTEVAAGWFASKFRNISPAHLQSANSTKTSVKIFELLENIRNSTEIYPHRILNDISEVIAISNPGKAIEFNDFWKNY